MVAKRSGLGRSLNELLGDGERVITTTKVSDKAEKPSAPTTQLPVEYLTRGEYQPRRDFDEASLRELADSIKSQGLIQPIIVRQQGDRYEIIAGERRWRAAQMAGLADVPVVVKALDDEQAIAMSLIENVQREDLNPMEEARALARIHEEFHSTHQEIATAIGKSRAHVSNLIRLTQSHPEVQAYLAKGAIEMGHARAIIALPDSEQIKAVKVVVQKSLTVRATERLVQQILNPTRSAPSPVVSSDISHLEAKLAEKLAAKVSIKHKKSGQGELVIHYNSVDELDGILNHIK